MIPFLKLKQDASASAPVDSIERKPDNEPEYDSLESAAEELCHAVESKDYKAIAVALRSAFEIMESETHEEESHG